MIYSSKKPSSVVFLGLCLFFVTVFFLMGVLVFKTVETLSTTTPNDQQPQPIEPTSFKFYSANTQNCPFQDKVRSCLRYQNDLNFSSFSSKRSSYLQQDYIERLIEVYSIATECAKELTCDKSLRSLFFDVDSKVNTFKVVVHICSFNQHCVTKLMAHQF